MDDSRYPSGFHGFDTVLPQASASRKFKEDIKEGVDWLLAKRI